MRANDEKQSVKHPKILPERNITHRKLSKKIEHVNLSSTSKRRRKRESFIAVKTKIHDVMWSTVHCRSHRYDVRAADRKALQVEQGLMKKIYDEAIDVTSGAPATTICRQNFEIKFYESKKEAKERKVLN
uniref:Uncharacterized protein n=1 Tax=Setaria digitata TaxID=48799 RepID=A0A915PVX0_9BILA